MVHKKSILVIDDEPDILEICSLALKDNYDVVLASSGSKAIELINTIDFDLIIVDLVMPKINGFDICKRFSKSKPIMVMTGINEISQSMIDEFEILRKPMGLDDIRNKVDSMFIS